MATVAARTDQMAVLMSSPDTFGPTDSTEGKMIDGSTFCSAPSITAMVSGVIDSAPSWACTRTIATC